MYRDKSKWRDPLHLGPERVNTAKIGHAKLIYRCNTIPFKFLENLLEEINKLILEKQRNEKQRERIVNKKQIGRLKS